MNILDLTNKAEFSEITTIKIGNTIKAFKKDCFNEYRNTVDTIDFSNCILEEIQPYLFLNFKKLKSIELPENIKILKSGSFYMCESLESIILHGIEEIQDEVFYSCNNIKYIYISDSIKKIHNWTFNGNKNTDVKIICPERFENYFHNKFPHAEFIYDNFNLMK